MGRIFLVMVIVVGVCITPAWANHDGQEDICHNSWVIFCENFNARATGQGDFTRATFKNRGWAYATLNRNAGTSSIVSVVDPTGAVSNAFQHLCTGFNGGANVCGSYIAGRAVSNAVDVFYRWYTKWSPGFVFSPTGNKHAGALYGPGPEGTNMNNQFGLGSFTLFYFPLGATPDNACAGSSFNSIGYYICQTMNQTAFQPNQWYCIETHQKLNSQPGVRKVDDGIAEMWINGVQVISRTNLNIDYRSTLTAADRYFTGVMFYPRWQCAGAGVTDGTDGDSCVCVNGPGTCTPTTHPVQQRWHDNVVMGTQRVGCLGVTPPPGDTTPPLSPSNLRVSSLWDQLLKVFWTLQ